MTIARTSAVRSIGRPPLALQPFDRYVVVVVCLPLFSLRVVYLACSLPISRGRTLWSLTLAQGHAAAVAPSISPKIEPDAEMEAHRPQRWRRRRTRSRGRRWWRRRRRTARLVGVYRRIYWAMAEEVRARHCQYVWEFGRSPFEAEQPPSAAGESARRYVWELSRSPLEAEQPPYTAGEAARLSARRPCPGGRSPEIGRAHV